MIIKDIEDEDVNVVDLIIKNIQSNGEKNIFICANKAESQYSIDKYILTITEYLPEKKDLKIINYPGNNKIELNKII